MPGMTKAHGSAGAQLARLAAPAEREQASCQLPASPALNVRTPSSSISVRSAACSSSWKAGLVRWLPCGVEGGGGGARAGPARTLLAALAVAPAPACSSDRHRPCVMERQDELTQADCLSWRHPCPGNALKPRCPAALPACTKISMSLVGARLG